MKKSKSVNLNDFKFSQEQLRKIIDRLVPVIAEKGDEEFFKGLLFVTFESTTTPAVAYFISNLLKEMDILQVIESNIEKSG